MEVEIRELRKSDHKKAIQFAITGMHFNLYMDNKFLVHIYGRYFWYLELTRSTQVIAAYAGKEFAGVLLAEMKGEEKRYCSFWKMLYVKAFEVLKQLFAKDGVGVYDKANKEMLQQYCEKNSPDGEIVFLAANPEIKIKGIGSLLLREFERREKGKKVFLYTDSACTYQFYECRGFERAGKKDIVMSLGNNDNDLQCFLYSKEL